MIHLDRIEQIRHKRLNQVRTVFREWIGELEMIIHVKSKSHKRLRRHKGISVDFGHAQP